MKADQTMRLASKVSCSTRHILVVAAMLMCLAPAATALIAEASAWREVWVVSANLMGTLEPCGCQADQAGGLPRRAALLAQLRKQDGFRLLDAGNVVSRNASNERVFVQAWEIMATLGYDVGVAGPGEIMLGTRALKGTRWGTRWLAQGNVLELSGGKLFARSKSITRPDGVTWTITSVVDPRAVPSTLAGGAPGELLGSALGRGPGTSVPLVVAYLDQHDTKELAAAATIPTLFLASGSGRPGNTQQVGKSWIVTLPTNGRSMLRIECTGRGSKILSVQGQDIAVDARLAPDEATQARIRAFWKREALRKDRSVAPLLGADIAGTKKSISAGAKSCGGCHSRQQKQWEATKHAHAWRTLVEKQETQRAECVGCHTTPLLAISDVGNTQSGVGCVTCHDTGLLHSSEPRNIAHIQRTPGESVCRTCHTDETSPRFDFLPYLRQIAH